MNWVYEDDGKTLTATVGMGVVFKIKPTDHISAERSFVSVHLGDTERWGEPDVHRVVSLLSNGAPDSDEAKRDAMNAFMTWYLEVLQIIRPTAFLPVLLDSLAGFDQDEVVSYLVNHSRVDEGVAREFIQTLQGDS